MVNVYENKRHYVQNINKNNTIVQLTVFD